MMKQWYVQIGGQRYGPVSEQDLRQWAIDRRVSRSDLVWSEGMPTWVPSGSLPELAMAYDAAPPGPPVLPPPQAGQLAIGPPLKSKLAAGLLGILIGAFGVHNFYLGYTGKAVAQLLLTLLTCGFGAIISSIWGLIEGILILTGSINQDGQGRPLGE